MNEAELEIVGRVLRWCIHDLSKAFDELVSWNDIGFCCGMLGNEAMELFVRGDYKISASKLFLPLILDHIAKRGVE